VLLEDLLRRLGLVVRLEQPGKLMSATLGVVDRTLAMQGQCLLSPLACLVELAKLSTAPRDVKADHGLINEILKSASADSRRQRNSAASLSAGLRKSRVLWGRVLSWPRSGQGRPG
jgi:hypothetical protein